MEKGKKIIILIFAIILLTWVVWTSKESRNYNYKFQQIWRGACCHNIKINDKIIATTISDTPEKREKGLSGAIKLKENTGMLFVFEQPAMHSFWMKDMLFSLDIIWMDENGNVVYIQKDAKSESYPESFTPDKPAKYVLEVNAGFSEKNNLKVGDEVKINL